jgi:hypothetical protein
MTIQKALEIIKNEMPYESGVINKALNMVENAVEKQIPKKPITETVNRGISVSGEYDIDFNYLCPHCNTVVGDYETDDAFYKFCPECGQALDWNDLKGETK